jgi:hypothetical protein
MFPVPVGVLLARWAWRYRFEIAPATTAGATLTSAWWLHATHPDWWAFPLAICGPTAFAVWSSAGTLG